MMRSFLVTATALTLFIGGIVILLFFGGFWGYILGIPAVQIGIVFIIFTFEKLSSIGIVFIIFTFEKLSSDSMDGDIERQKEEFKKLKR
ncbi:MAG: hypothetical protein UT20_C0058G0004 [Candidatus Levybacteria bacterium GW2011_GWA1_39_11]|nr:MAG: hypothetical protein UT20_C0058G0004 [Candidatus Levybacteria bacterium GW2011_GWA1_39_11]